MIIHKTPTFYIETHDSEIPWLKIFTTIPYKELTEVPKPLRKQLYEIMEIIEEEMLSYYKPEKINIAAFGNYLPHVHIHVMARFKKDSYFPEPMWGIKQRESNLQLRNAEQFYNNVISVIKTKKVF
ncbi:HIT domain-containing protein [Sulfurimonas sp. MAG313]|nr:HIT domain-containing protein [Sulfurimonas sp. MAG313]MDF1880762.1 HIT domain-containing protein [Sulfurimonas sp. MAG313]